MSELTSDLSIEKQTHTYKTVGDTAIQADVYTSQPLAPRPVLLWIHGGALINGSRSQLASFRMEEYLRAGFTVVSIDYRLAPETKIDGILADVQDAYAWIVREGPQLFALDGERIAVAGQSAGGYLTLMTGICAQPRPKALVAFYGYGDIIGDWYSRPDAFYRRQPLLSEEEARSGVGHGIATEGQGGGPRSRFYLYCRQNGLWPSEVGGHDPAVEPQWFTPYCPVQNVTSAYPPTLLLHGVRDTDVPYEQSLMMADQLAAHNVEHEFFTSPEGGHGFDGRRGSEDTPEVAAAYAKVIEFLCRHIYS
jgi:acetyl esterase/lipase